MDNGNSVRRVMCPMENVSTTFQSLDTVRALHQTVVSLRSALEEAKFEIQRLRSQISSQSEIKQGAKYRKTAEEPSTNKDVDLDEDDEHCDHHNKRSKRHFIKESTVPPVEESQSTDNDDQQPEQIHQVELRVPDPHEEPPSATSCPHHHEPHTHHTHHVCSSKLHKGEKKPRISIYPDISVVAHPKMSDDNSKQMASKIDVKIKVMSNIKVDGSSSDTTSASQQASDKEDDSSEQGHHHHHHHGHSSDGGHHLHTTSDDSIKTHKGNEGAFIVSHSSKEDINVDDNENSQSEGDNSVFIETKPRKTGGQGRSKPEAKGLDKDQESKEEVDDIELIFSSDENRDPIQEDLVSISEYYPFQNAGNSGTPVLLKFASLPSDQEPGQEPSKSATLPTSTTCDVFFDPDSAGLSQDKSLESNDSFENQCTKSSSLDKENSLERKDDTHITRDESLDFFDNRDLSVNRKWTNYNVLVETDISKCGIVEETTFEMYRRNTCPNPPAYRPPAHRDNCLARHIPSRLASRYCRRVQYGQGGANSQGSGANGDEKFAPKRSSSAQTEISALPDYWKSESQLAGDRYHMAGCTLPSKFVPTIKSGCHKHSLRISERTQEARRVLLSDINFTSMVPELSRSADHLCQEERRQEPGGKQSNRYYKGNLLKTPDYALKGITPSVSMTSPGVSQWTVNESSFGTQTIQTAESWGKRGDSFDSCKSYSTGSRYSGLDRHHRSRSVPSFRCAICKQAHGGQGIRTSESMHYTPRVTFQEPACKIRGSLPDLRHDCVCSRRYTGRSIFPIHGDSSGSTESLLDEADTFVRKSTESAIVPEETTSSKRPNLRRMSETDIQRDYIPSKQSLPFLPKTAKCLKPGHLAKVISKSGRVVVGRVRYVGPLATVDKNGGKVADDLYVGVQLQSKCGDCDGTYDGRKFFDCEPLQGLFVPFKKVVMAWTA